MSACTHTHRSLPSLQIVSRENTKISNARDCIIVDSVVAAAAATAAAAAAAAVAVLVLLTSVYHLAQGSTFRL